MDNVAEEFLAANQEKNNIKQSVFHQFTPLYTIHSGYSEGQLRELMHRFRTIVNPYLPIHVQDDQTGTVLFTLPPMLTRVATLDPRVLEGNEELMSRYVHIMANPDFSPARQHAIGEELFHVYEQSQMLAQQEMPPVLAPVDPDRTTDDWEWQ